MHHFADFKTWCQMAKFVTNVFFHKSHETTKINFQFLSMFSYLQGAPYFQRTKIPQIHRYVILTGQPNLSTNFRVRLGDHTNRSYYLNYDFGWNSGVNFVFQIYYHIIYTSHGRVRNNVIRLNFVFITNEIATFRILN